MTQESQTVIRWTDPSKLEHSMASLGGMDHLRKILSGELPPPPIEVTMGIRLVEFKERECVHEATPGGHHCNPMGIAHASFAVAVLDTAMAWALRSALPAGMAQSTLELKTNFVRPVTVASGPMRSVGQVITLGRRTATAEAKLFDRADRLCAFANSTSLLFPFESGAG